MVTGCLLIDAPPAAAQPIVVTAQPLLSAPPHWTGSQPPSHGTRGDGAARPHGASGHGPPSRQAPRHGPLSREAWPPSHPAAPSSHHAPTRPTPPAGSPGMTTQAGGLSPQSATSPPAGTVEERGRTSPGAGGRSRQGRGGSGELRIQAWAGRSDRGAGNPNRPAGPKPHVSAHPGANGGRGADGKGAAAAGLLQLVTRPERLFGMNVSPLAPVAPVASGRPGPSSTSAGPAMVMPPNPFRLPFFLPRGWEGDTVQAATKLKVPLALLAAMVVFALVQALVDRRDPKLSEAPERPGEDSVGFE